MFIVFNKEKIYSYVIVLSAIVILFIIESNISNIKDGINLCNRIYEVVNNIIKLF